MSVIRQKISKSVKKFNDTQLRNFCSLTGLGQFYEANFKQEYSWYNFGLYVQLLLQDLNIDLRRKTQEEMDEIIWHTFVNWEEIYNK